MKPSIKTAVERTVISTRESAARIARLKNCINKDIDTIESTTEVPNDAPFCKYIAIICGPDEDSPTRPLVVEYDNPDYFKTIIKYCGEIGLACDRLVNYIRCGVSSADTHGGDIE